MSATYLFIKVDVLEIVIQLLGEPGSVQLLLGIVRQPFLIELPLEILECQGIVENRDITSRGRGEISSFLEGGCKRSAYRCKSGHNE